MGCGDRRTPCFLRVDEFPVGVYQELGLYVVLPYFPAWKP